MTVKELIKELKKLDGKMEVQVLNAGYVVEHDGLPTLVKNGARYLDRVLVDKNQYSDDQVVILD